MATLDYFQSQGSVGFKVTSYFSPNSRLGTREDFQQFVNTLHLHDIGIILVWIPNHFSNNHDCPIGFTISMEHPFLGISLVLWRTLLIFEARDAEFSFIERCVLGSRDARRWILCRLYWSDPSSQ